VCVYACVHVCACMRSCVCVLCVCVCRKLGVDYDERVLPSIVNEILKSVVAQYNAAQLTTQREEGVCVLRYWAVCLFWCSYVCVSACVRVYICVSVCVRVQSLV